VARCRQDSLVQTSQLANEDAPPASKTLGWHLARDRSGSLQPAATPEGPAPIFGRGTVCRRIYSRCCHPAAVILKP
jgi:hypothetical protein